MKLKHDLPKHAVADISFIPRNQGGESGWIIYLKPGFSFDPMADDFSRFVPASDPQEVDGFVIYTYTAAKSASAAD
jgi:hypothetical protein